MSNGVTTTPPNQAVTIQAKQEVEYIPFGSEDRIKLSLAVIRNYIATPTKEKELPDDRDCMRFLMLCRSRRLDPFTGDAYLIGFKKHGTDKAEWSLITSQSAFMKRAEIHPEFDGLQSGVIVKSPDDQIVEREGDFLFEGDTLLGGWAVVYFKTRKFPMRKKVQLKTYHKAFGVWLTDPAGMICKVAEVHALRDAFPTMLGGMMLREETVEIPSEVVGSREIKRPEFTQGLPAPDLNPTPATNPVRKVANTRAGTQQAPQEPKPAVSTPPDAQNAAQSPAANENTPSGEPTPPSDEKAEAALGLAPSQNETAAPADKPATTTTVAAPAPAGPKVDPATFKPRDGETMALTAVRRWLHGEGRTEPELMKVLVSNKAAKPGQKLSEMSESKLDNVYKARATLATQMSQQPAS